MVQKFKFYLKVLLKNLIILSGLLLVIEIFLDFYIKISFEEKQNIIFSYWKHPLDKMGEIENPLFGAWIAHPIWGFTMNPAIAGNNLGFASKEDYPIIKNENEYTVGIFGVSVANFFGSYVERSASHVKVKVCNKDKTIKFTNYALAAYKQPQQFNVFHSFLDSFDMAINLDGYNDATMEGGRGYPVYYPVFFEDMYLLTSFKLKALEANYKYKKIEYLLLSSLKQNAYLLHSNLVFALSKNIIKTLDEIKISKKPHLDEKDNASWDRLKRQEELVNVWSKYVKMQNQISLANKKPSLFFIQPTQYLPGLQDAYRK